MAVEVEVKPVGAASWAGNINKFNLTADRRRRLQGEREREKAREWPQKEKASHTLPARERVTVTVTNKAASNKLLRSVLRPRGTCN